MNKTPQRRLFPKPLPGSVSVIVPNHGRDLSLLKHSLPADVEFLEIDLGMERSKQRNIGITQAKGEILLILDSDQSIHPGLINELRDLFKLNYSAIYIPEIIVAKSFFGRIRAFERTFYNGTAVDVPRAVLAKACPFFDERLHGPEDSDWGNRIRGVRAVSRHPLYHHDDIGFIEYCRKKAYYTKSMRRYANKWPDDPVLKFKYRCWTVFTENGKWKNLIRHPVLTLGIIFVLIVRGIIYAKNR
jgi:glycosyltransferase involved in cell wall biosynthesis